MQPFCAGATEKDKKGKELFMKKKELNAFLIKEDLIEIQLDEETVEEFPFFILRNRKSKQEYRISIELGDNDRQLVLPYREIDLMETGFNRYDLLIEDQSGHVFRPKLQNSGIDFKNIKATPFYFTDRNNGFKFYITKDEEISLVAGNYIKVEKEFYQSKTIVFSMKEISLQENTLQFALPNQNINATLFFWWENGKTIIPIEKLEILNRDNKCQVSIALDEVELNNIENFELKVAFLKEEILYEAKLITDEELLISLPEGVSVFCWANKKNEVRFSSSPLVYIKQFGVNKENSVIEHYSLDDKEITLTTKEPFRQGEMYLYLEDIVNGSFSRIVDFKQSEKQLTIPNPIAQKDMHEIVGHRYRFIAILDEGMVTEPESLEAIHQYSCLGFYSASPSFLKSEKYGRSLTLDAGHLCVPYWSVNDELIFHVLNEEQYVTNRYDRMNINYSCHNLQCEGGKLSFSIENFHYTDEKKVNFYLQERKTKNRVDVDFSIQEGNLVELDVHPFIEGLELEASRWDLFIEIYNSETIVFGKIGCFSSSVKNKYDRYFSPLNEVNEAEENNFALIPYLTIKNEIAFIWNEENKVRNEQFDCKIKVIDSKVKENFIEIKAELTDIGVENYTIDSGTIVLRNKAHHLEYEIPVQVIEKNDNKCQVLVSIEPSKYYLIPFFWDIYVNIGVDSKVHRVRVKNPIKAIKTHIDNQINENEINLSDNFMIYPYITADNSYALCFRERAAYENNINRLKEKIAHRVYLMFKDYFDKKDIWLGFEKNAANAQDNGYQFFNYCYNNNKKDNFYYIIKPDSEDYKDIQHQKKNIIKFMSFKYMLYMYAAKLLISSESKGHSYDIRIQKGRIKEFLDKKKLVFLQHGVTALKRVDYVFKKKKGNAVSLFTATSDYEKEIIKEYFNYNESEIMVTGFTRWDVLEDKSTLEDKKIFIMPTWRSWMDGIREEEFLNSEYYQKYRDILESKELNEMLERHNITLHFLLHPKFIEHSNKFDLGGNRIVTHQFGEVKINEMLMESSLLITDYSSVSWEFYYMKKPVVFYQFDRDDYSKYQGSYLDLENELFGDSAQEINQLLEHIHYYIENDFKEKEVYAAARSKYFKYVDRNNSERTFNEIMKNKKRIYNSK